MKLSDADTYIFLLSSNLADHWGSMQEAKNQTLEKRCSIKKKNWKYDKDMNVLIELYELFKYLWMVMYVP